MGVHVEILACIVRFIFCRIEYTECKNAASCRRSIVYVYTCQSVRYIHELCYNGWTDRDAV